MSEIAEYAAPTIEPASPEPVLATADDTRVWVMRRHPRHRLCQAHAIIAVDWAAGVARTSCGLELERDAIDDIPDGGCMPCIVCIAATPLPA